MPHRDYGQVFVRIPITIVILQGISCAVPDLEIRCAVLERVDRAACVGALALPCL